MNIYYFIVLIFVLISSKANFLFESNLAWFLFEAFLLIIAVNLNKLKSRDIRFFLWVMGLYFLYVVVRFIINSLSVDYLISDVFYFFKFVIPSFLFCAILREKALFYLVKVITHLAAISLIFYLVQFIQNGAIVKAIGNTFEGITVNDGSSRYTNFLMFTFDQLHNYRNSGFSWEPGAFGSFLVLALLINFLINEFKIDRTSILIVLAVITTLSTTAYFGLFLVFFLRFRVRQKNNKLALIALVGLLVIAVPNVPFLGNKIVEIYENDLMDLRRLEELSVYYEDVDRQIPLNRFSSAIFLYEQFNWKLILGVSNQYDEYFKYKLNVNLSNGLIDFIAKFGVVGLTLLFYRFGSLCNRYLKNLECTLYTVLILITLSFGEPILILPISILFYFLPNFKEFDFQSLAESYQLQYVGNSPKKMVS